MNKTITMTTKGTFTLPAHVRKAMGISDKGDKLTYEYDEVNKRVTIEKPTVDLLALQKNMAQYIKPGTKPVKNVGDFYQKNRTVS